jgi:hypothetical protein
MAKSISVKRKKAGRPATGTDPLYGVRITDALMTQIMNWAGANGATRSEAIRRLVELGLTVKVLARPVSKPDRRLRAAELAAKAIDKIADPAALREERAQRQRRLTKGPEEFREVRVDRPKSKRWFSGGRNKAMSKKPKIDHDYDEDKDKLTITIHRYSLKRKKDRNAIIETLMATLDSKSATKKKSKTMVRNKKLEITTEEWCSDTAPSAGWSTSRSRRRSEIARTSHRDETSAPSPIHAGPTPSPSPLGRDRAEGEEVNPIDPPEERVIYRKRFQGEQFDFRGQSIFTRYDRCEFVKCTLLIDRATEQLAFTACVFKDCNIDKLEPDEARGLYVMDNFFDRPLDQRRAEFEIRLAQALAARRTTEKWQAINSAHGKMHSQQGVSILR